MDDEYQKKEAVRKAKIHGLINDSQATAQAKLLNALSSIKDESTNIDTGFGHDGMDFWIWIDGKEYLLTAHYTNKQIAREAQ